MAWTFAVEGWQPARLNQWDGRHWSARAKAKKADRRVIALAAKLAGIPRATGNRRVSLHLTLEPRQRAPDVDAHWKSLLDGLTAAGLLRDDNRKWCELGTVTYSRGPSRATRVELEDVDPGPGRPPSKGTAAGGPHP